MSVVKRKKDQRWRDDFEDKKAANDPKAANSNKGIKIVGIKNRDKENAQKERLQNHAKIKAQEVEKYFFAVQ